MNAKLKLYFYILKSWFTDEISMISVCMSNLLLVFEL